MAIKRGIRLQFSKPNQNINLLATQWRDAMHPIAHNTHPSFISLLSKCRTLTQLKQLQASLITHGDGDSPFFSFHLIKLLTFHLHNFPYALRIFTHFSSPNTHLFSAIFNAYASLSDHRALFLLYLDLARRARPRANEFVYPHVLRAAFEVLGVRGVEMVRAQVVKNGFEGNPVVGSAVVDVYARVEGGVGVARKVFDEMSERNLVAWTAMVSRYCRVGEMGNAIVLFEEMEERDVPAWNSIISGCNRNGLFLEAITFFRKMVNSAESEQRKEGCRPNWVTLACALSACGSAGLLHLGKSIHGYVYRTRFKSNLSSFLSNALIDMYGKCGCLKLARRVFDITEDRCLLTWNSMITCYALHGQTKSALDVFEEMVRSNDGIHPDEITFIGVLNACSHGGLVEKGYFYFNLMRNSYGFDPCIEHYGCLVDLMGRAGRFGDAMEVIKGMNTEPDEVIWGSLLNGCKIHGNVELGELAIKKLSEIDPKNGGYMSMFANLYGELDKWDEVRKVRKALKDGNAQKMLGCSWIEVDGRVHQFRSSESSHSQIEEICNVLECLVSCFHVIGA